MNETEAKDVWVFLLESLKETKGFAIEQAPDVIQQLVFWKAWQYGLMACFLLVCVVGLIVAIFAICRVIDRHDNICPEAGKLIARILGGGIAALVTGFFLDQAYWLLMLWLAPKVFVLEYVSGLIR